MKNLEVIAIWPDVLISEHNIFNHLLYQGVLLKKTSLSILACPSFIHIQNSFANNRVPFDAIFSNLYEITKHLDEEAKRNNQNCNEIRGANIIYLSDLITAAQYLDIGRKILNETCGNLIQLKYLRSDVGEAAGIDLSLTLKAQFCDAGDPDVQEFIKLTIFHNIVAVEAINILLDKRKRLTSSGNLLICQNSVYSQNLAIANYARKKGIKHVFYEASPIELNRIKVYSNQILDQVHRRMLMSGPFNHGEYSNYYKHAKKYLNHRMGHTSTHSYSPSNNRYLNLTIEQVFPQCKNKKRYVYYGNSPDELQSITINAKLLNAYSILRQNTKPFKDEFENLHCLIKHAEKTPSDTFFIRTHPRLGKDHRGLGTSFSKNEYIERIKNMEPPENVILIYPEEDIPSYWLGCWCNGILSFRGTMPLEMNLLGYTPLIGSSDLGTINSTIDVHAYESRRSREEWSKCLSSLENDYLEGQLNEFVREFYYSRTLGTIDLSKLTHDESSLELLLESLYKGSSLLKIEMNFNRLREENPKELTAYILWLQEFIVKNIVSRSEAPVFSILSRHLANQTKLQ